MKTIWNIKNENKKLSSYVALVERIYNEENQPQRYSGTIESMLKEFFSRTSKKKHTWKRETFKNLLIHVHNQKGYALLRAYGYVKVLHNMSSFGNKLVRPIEDWKSTDLDPRMFLSSLVQHCFAKYETPKFLENAFYDDNNLHMLWYVQLGKGKSVLNLTNIPVGFTYKMAHIFRTAPDYFYVNQALRYAQAVSYGAQPDAAKVIAYSDLADVRSEHEVFWSSVVQFFSKEECLESNELNHMVEYLGAKYYEDQTFSMKGRTFNALMHQTNEWHRRKHFENAEVLQWDASGIPPLYIEEELNGNMVVYKTIELRNSYELYEEGEAMSHCVAEYEDVCSNQESAIFSLQKEVLGQPAERMATLEVSLPCAYLVQVNAKYNEKPCHEAERLIGYWVNTKAVKKYSETVQQQPYQPVAYRRLVEREQMRTQDWDVNIKWLLRLFLWILYFIFIITRASNSQSSSFSFEYKAPYELDIYNSRMIDSILEASYKVNWPKDSIINNLNEIKWQNLN